MPQRRRERTASLSSSSACDSGTCMKLLLAAHSRHCNRVAHKQPIPSAHVDGDVERVRRIRELRARHSPAHHPARVMRSQHSMHQT